MGAAEDVGAQFINPGDLNTLYEGSSAPKKVIDLRGMIKYITWDLLRFQKPSAFVDPTRDWVNTPIGMRDSASRQAVLTEQNNVMLRLLCKQAGINLTGQLPGE